MAAINDETFHLKLDGLVVPIASSYRVSSGVFEVPAGFDMTVGHSGVIVELLKFYPEFCPFELFVGDLRVAEGELDTHTLVGGDGSQLRLTGREMLKWLVDTRLDNDRTFAEKTFFDLTRTALDEVGLSDRKIVTDNTANRKAISGKNVVPIPAQEVTQTPTGGAESSPQTKTVYQTLEAEVGSTWWDFLKSQYRRAGLFLWSASDGSFILSKPDGAQSPLYRIVRRRGGRAGDVTVVGQPRFERNGTKRYSEVRVFGRAGSGKAGRGRISGVAYDDEIIALLNPVASDRTNGGKRRKPFVIHDDKIRTTEEAEFLALRKLAETRRAGWTLDYTVAGHTVPALVGGGRLVWQKDTTVEVIDEELGIEGVFYIESCEYTRAPQTNTVLHLQRPGDMVFAEEDLDRVPKVTGPPPSPAIPEKFERKIIWRKDPLRGNLPVAYMTTPSGILMPFISS